MNAATIQSVRDAITCAYPFTIDKLPLYGPDRMATPHYGLFKSDDSQCLPISVKRGYNPHTLDDIMALAEAGITAFDSAHDAQVTCHWSKRGHEVIIAPSKEYRRSIFGTADNIFPRMRIGGYFGRTFEVETGLFRDLCKNLMIDRSVKSSAVAIRHTSQLRSKMDELISVCKTSADSFESLADIAAQLEERRVSVADFMAQLYPAPAETDSKKALTQAKNRTEAILSRLVRENAEAGRPPIGKSATLWQMLNAVTGYVQHDKTRHKIGGAPMSTVERALVGVNDGETADAWQLAEQLLAS